jgi:hypothetical protein
MMKRIKCWFDCWRWTFFRRNRKRFDEMEQAVIFLTNDMRVICRDKTSTEADDIIFKWKWQFERECQLLFGTSDIPKEFLEKRELNLPCKEFPSTV